MTKPIPTIAKYMTTAPHHVGKDQPLTLASATMKKHDIRHLPVLHGGVLEGMITARDITLIEALRDVDVAKVTVEDAMSTEVYAVTPDTPLDQVVNTMAERKYGSAVVMDNQHVVGIFTTVDACRSLAELLNTRLAK